MEGSKTKTVRYNTTKMWINSVIFSGELHYSHIFSEKKQAIPNIFSNYGFNDHFVTMDTENIVFPSMQSALCYYANNNTQIP